MNRVHPSACRCFITALVFVTPLLGAVGTEAATYYVAASGGSDARSCATASAAATPKQTITSGMSCLTQPGDTLYVRAGTYNERVTYPSLPTSGTQAQRITIAGYPGDARPVIRPTTALCYHVLMGNKNWITMDGINIDGSGYHGGCLIGPGGTDIGFGSLTIDSVSGVTGLTFRNMDIANSPGSNVLHACDQCLLEKMTVHATGLWAMNHGYKNGSNGLYLETFTNSTLRAIETYDNACFGFRLYKSSAGSPAMNNIVEAMYSHHNGLGVGLSGASNLCSADGGILIGDTNNTVRNSISANNHGFGLWVSQEGNQASGNKYLNNISYGNINPCTSSCNAAGAQSQGVTQSTTWANNLVVGNAGGLNVQINAAGAGDTQTTNHTTGVITDCTLSTTDFRLKAAGNPCIDAGTTIPSVTNDFVRAPRPQGGLYDIGAYEGSGTTSALSPPLNLRVF